MCSATCVDKDSQTVVVPAREPVIGCIWSVCW